MRLTNRSTFAKYIWASFVSNTILDYYFFHPAAFSYVLFFLLKMSFGLYNPNLVWKFELYNPNCISMHLALKIASKRHTRAFVILTCYNPFFFPKCPSGYIIQTGLLQFGPVWILKSELYSSIFFLSVLYILC